MKKILALILSLCFIATIFVGCGGNNTDVSSGSNTTGNNEVVNIADFEGVWSIDNAVAKIVKINSADSTVIAYTDDGYEIGTFAAVATEQGLALKMGAFGDVVLKDVASLTITTVPAVTTAPDLKGKWNYVCGHRPADCVLDMAALSGDKGDFSMSGTKKNGSAYTSSGTYMIDKEEMTAHILHYGFAGATGKEPHVIVGGGDALYYIDSGEVYVRETSANKNALANRYLLMVSEWKAQDEESVTAKFKENGKLEISGGEVGIWYTTNSGLTVEYTDGTVDTVEIKDNSFALAFIGKTFVK